MADARRAVATSPAPTLIVRRRKLAALEERGWILRNADGSCRLAVADGQTAARRDLSDVDRRALHRVARLFADLEALVAVHPPKDAKERPQEGARNEHPEAAET